MAKTKEQKRLEAQQRAVANTGHLTQDLLWWMRQHLFETANMVYSPWTVNTLKSKVQRFYDHLRDCGLPHDVGAFYIYPDRVLIAQDPAGVYKRSERKCLYCLQPFGQHHKAPCANETSGRVAHHEALFIDGRK